MNLKNRQVTQAVNQKVVDQKEILQNLYGCIKDAKSELARLEEQLKSHNDLTESLLKLREEADGKLYDIKKRVKVLDVLQIEIDSAGEKLSGLITQIEAKRKECKELVSQTEYDIGKSVGDAQEFVRGEMIKAQAVEIKVKEMKATLADLVARVDERLGQCGLIEERILEKEKECSELALRAESLKGQNLQEESLLKEVEEKVVEAKERLAALHKEVDDVQKRLGSTDEEIAKRYGELVTREGEASSRERLLEEKTKSLQAAKKQLEEYFNKPLNSLII